MCYNPVHIDLRHGSCNSISQNGEIYSEHRGFAVDVPCGHCEQCLSAKRDAYLLRCLSELDRTYTVAFCTLTYANQHLPYIYQYSRPVFHPSGECLAPSKRYRRSVWDKTHVQKFFKQLNERIIYYVGTEVYGLQRLATINGHRCITQEWKEFLANFERPIRYICVCERGKNNIYKDDKSDIRRGTKRPHYHCIIFCNCEHISNGFLLSLVKELWTYGLSYNILLGGPEGDYTRDTYKSLTYVIKYITKDIQDISHHLLYADHDMALRHCPFVLTSNFIGNNLLENYTEEQLLFHLVNGVTIPGTDFSLERTIPVPRYYNRYSKEYVSVNDGKYISTRVAKPEVFCDGYQPIFLDNECEFEHSVYPKRLNLLTDFGRKVREGRTALRIKTFVEHYRNIILNPQIFTYALIHSLSCITQDYITDILSCDYEQFLSMVQNPYAYNKGDMSDLNYRAYLGVKQFITTMSRIKHFETEMAYKMNFEKAISENPEPLCIQPL